MKTEELERWLDRAPKGKKKMPALKGVRGRVKFEVEGGGAAYLLRIEEGEVELTPGGDHAEAVVICESKAEIARMLRGEVHPVVETLQGRAAGQGDRALALRVALDLRGGSPFAERKEARKKEGAK